MDSLGKYILSLISAAIIFGILQSLLDQKSGTHTLLRFIGGIFLTFTIIAPITDIDLNVLFDLPMDFIEKANTVAASGQQRMQTQQRDIIKEQCEAYILDKAFSYEIKPEVEVILQDDMAIPEYVRINGTIPHYTKIALKAWIEDEMGIPRENQIWIG